MLDLPGCIAAGQTLGEVESVISEAIALPIEEMIEDGLPVPQPVNQVERVEVAAWKANPLDVYSVPDLDR